jgi:hypothetical protein
MYKNGAVYKTPDGKFIVLLFLHGDVYCLLEVIGGKLSVIQAEKWEFPESELPRRLEDFEYLEGGYASIQEPAPTIKETVQSTFTRKKK